MYFFLIEKVIFQLPPECLPMPPMAAPIATIDARIIPEAMARQEHEKVRQNFAPSQYVELII